MFLMMQPCKKISFKHGDLIVYVYVNMCICELVSTGDL
jgi:hypothetical protein